MCLGFFIEKRHIRIWPARCNERVSIVRALLPELFSNKWDHRVQKPKGTLEDNREDVLNFASCLSVIAADTRFGLISFTIWG